MLLRHFFLLTLIDLSLSLESAKLYNGYTLYRSVPSTQSHLDFLKNISSEIPVDFWKRPGLVNMPVDLLIGPGAKEIFVRKMDEKKYLYKTLTENVQSAIDNQTVKSYIRRRMDTFDWENYYHLNDIYNWFYDLEEKYPREVTILTLGTTAENNKILAIKVRFPNAKVRSTVIVEGGIHAREWISHAFVTYLLNHILASGKGREDNTWKKLALTYEWYFIPVVNPDGYQYTRYYNRLWRKNRRYGFGVDVNRNFDIAFGTTGVEHSLISDINCGEYAFSEAESSALAKLVRYKKDDLEYYLAFHSYGQYMIIPYAYSRNHMHNYDEVENILLEAKKRLARRYNTRYTVGTAYDTVGYTTSGVSGCWVKAKFNVRYVATFELRDSDEGNSKGFLLPENQILPTCLETLDALEYILTPKHEKFVKLSDSATSRFNGISTFVLETILSYILIFYYIIILFGCT